ncbi:AP-3 complex subunit sigma-2-like [Hylaeus volcanicus]|uniref:AP-3 complex subunit sigma-2-like n=1 Tax=Hylaeus volcanicus TaxID=313075 RepID=UPI0023B8518C|nr:AP-3 complex subunit sigma-2-like [Hylaeus volcanicus]
MILAVLVMNKNGKARIARFYNDVEFEKQQYLIQRIHSLVVKQNKELNSNIVDSSLLFGNNSRITFRCFTTLYFIVVHDNNESPLSILDLIQVLVETLNCYFENVCELDIIFNFDKVNYILDEFIVAGIVTTLNMKELCDKIKLNQKISQSQSSKTIEGVLEKIKHFSLS